MSRIYLHEFDRPDVEINPTETVVFERSDGASVSIRFDADGEIRVSNDDGRVLVSPEARNVLVLIPTSRAVESAARRVRKVLGRDGTLDNDADYNDVRTLVEAALR